MLVLTGPPKLEGVMLGTNIVKNGRIHQEIKWNAPVLRYNDFPEYIIRYADSLRALFDSRNVQSSVANSTLQLNFRTTNITYYIVVAVRSAGDQKRGDFSDPVSITYTSEFAHAQLNFMLQDNTDAWTRWGPHIFCNDIHAYIYYWYYWY